MQIHGFRGQGLRRAALLIAFLAAALLCFRQIIWKMLGILFGAAAIAFVLAPLCKLLEKHIKRSWAALIALAALVLLIGAAFALALPALLRQMTALLSLLPEAIDRIKALLDRIAAVLQAQAPDFALPELNFSGMEGSLTQAAQGAIATVSGLADGLYRIFLMASLSYFLLADRDRILLRLELWIPSTWRSFAVRAGNSLLREMRLYLKGQATIALAVGGLAALSMLAIGLEGAPLLGLLVGIFNVIPYFGPILGGIPAMVAALGFGWRRAAITLAALFLVQQADGLLISPRVMGNITGFSPAVVLIAVFIGAQGFGIGGMLLALPALLAGRTVYRVFVQRREND